MVITNFNEVEWGRAIFQQAMRHEGARKRLTFSQARGLRDRIKKAADRELVRAANYIGETFIGTIYGGRIALIDVDDIRSATGLPSLVSRTRSVGSRLERRGQSDQQYFRDLYARAVVGGTRGSPSRLRAGDVAVASVARLADIAERFASPGEQAKSINIFGHELQQRYSIPYIRWQPHTGNYLRQKRKLSPLSGRANFFLYPGRSSGGSIYKLKRYFRERAGRRILRATGGVRVLMVPRNRAESVFFRSGRGTRVPIRSILAELRVTFLPKIPIGMKNRLLAGGPGVGHNYVDFEYQVFPKIIADKLSNPEYTERHRPLVQPVLSWWLVHRLPLVMQQVVVRATQRR